MKDSVIRSGVLFKQGLGGVFHRKNWKTRFFILTKTNLLYYTSETGLLKGKLDITQCTENSIEIMPENDRKSGGSTSSIWRIAINTSSRRLLVAAISEMEMNAWIDAFKAVFKASSSSKFDNQLQ